MESKQVIKMALDMNMGAAVPLIEDMKEAPLTFPTPNGGCHPLWVLGHMAYSAGALIQQFALGQANPYAHWKDIFGGGSEPTDDPSVYPPFDEVMAACRKAHEDCAAVLDGLSEADLDADAKAAPEEYRQYFGTVRLCFLAMASHWGMHRGQLADARRAAGRDRLGP